MLFSIAEKSETNHGPDVSINLLCKQQMTLYFILFMDKNFILLLLQYLQINKTKLNI